MVEEKIEMRQEELKKYTNVSFDSIIDGSISMGKADVLISDKSGVRFDFALLYERPVITIDAPLKDVEQYEYAELKECWEDSIQEQLGAVVYPQGRFDIVPIIEQALHMPTKHFVDFRNTYVKNFTTSGNAIVDWTWQKVQQCTK